MGTASPSPGDAALDYARFVRDLTSLLSLPAFWTGRDPEFVLRTLLEAIEALVPADACYASVTLAPGERLELLRAGRISLHPSNAAWAPIVACAWSEPAAEAILDLGTAEAPLTAMRVPIGYAGEVGRVVVASRRAGFPDAADQTAIRTATTLGASGIETARVIQQRDRAERAKDEFLAMLGHELRNPLAPIVTALALMARRAGGERSREQVIIERQVSHLRTLVNDLLDVSRITRGKLELQPQRVDVADIVSRALEVVAPLVRERSHETRVRVPLGIPVDADPTRLTQVLSNLLTNAARYTPPGGRIGVTAAVEGAEVVIIVSDTGMGIAAELLPRLFDLFVQGPRGLARAEGGLGIGLTLVRNLVTAHGGTVTAASAGPGTGSTFTVRLPIASGPAAEVIAPAAAREQPLPATRILIVDDNRDAAELTAELLRGDGHEVDVALSGHAALERAAIVQPEVVLLDIGLPGLDGYAVAAALRREARAGAPRIVALTGYGQVADFDRSRLAGFDAHLVKPVDPGRLRATLERVLRGQPGPT